ncbi:sugar phosphate isomerase [Mangrovactinospora gilvigrisea]|uniref:Sugar phosphate isomerase n=1 Tax=Mangrovactinospora gilvigrisea TaxID=1428644 RepID=A0A1J7C2Q8_9ACTN|nr:sugar phosphate isomerase/epimerase [Mangrovactinospora gilvigrisea]OIV35852.1 sugar phosphate isomerase [Mangrovactinospora gilvigrisea]
MRRISPTAIGIQLYTVRDLMEKDAAGTLAELGRIGYATVGVSGRYGHSHAEFRAMADDAGVRPVLTHLPLTAVREDWAGELEGARVLGVDHVVVPALPVELRNPDGYRAVAEEFNEAGRAAKEAGFQFLYHNHAFDFEVVDGVRLYDIFVERCDPELVKFELDLYWAVKGGVDPVAYFDASPGRFPALHVKDMAEDGSFEDVGSGTLDFAQLFDRALAAGSQEFVVEHDAPGDSLASARASYTYLKNFEF